jgi:NTP pyrophosphatase (non-canonical NTP hydrolase)
MEILQAQEKISEFDKARGWGDNWDLKDLLLNITEEGGELWNLIKWVEEDKQKEICIKEKEEVSDYIGDTLFLVLKLANQAKINADIALTNTLNEYEARFPVETMRNVDHANKLAGGVDNK